MTERGYMFEPKLIGFLCNWCSYAGSDLAGTSRLHHDMSVRAIRVMCSGRVEPAFVVKAFAQGADGVIIAGCHIPADCHYTNGNFKALARFEAFLPLLDVLGIERERLQLHWISASEGEKFARVMNEFSETIRNLGPLKLSRPEFCSDPETRGSTSFVCPVIRQSQEFAACEAASSGIISLDARISSHLPLRYMEPSIVFDPNKCVRCGSCVQACRLQGIEAIRIDESEGLVIDDSKCVRCGQCVLSCPLSFTDKTIKHVHELLGCGSCPHGRPVGAAAENDDTALVLEALKSKDKYLVAQFAPSVRTTIGEEFAIRQGTVPCLTVKKLFTAFREIGFKKVCDTNFTADLTIMEEGAEFLGRIKTAGVTPMFTSCCPAWIRFVETNYPGLIPNLSTAKSPQQMLGAVAKTALAKRVGVDAADMFVVSVMPCTAKKFERMREEMNSASVYWGENGKNSGSYPDVDAVLTTRECAKLLKLCGVDPAAVSESEPDDLLGEFTGAAAIFGRSGGVMTAALRTAHEIATGSELADFELTELGGSDFAGLADSDLKGLADSDLAKHGVARGIKTAVVQAGDVMLRVAVASGLRNARVICEDILSGGDFSKYDFIEVMACPGGCVGGGGQTIASAKSTVAERAKKLDNEDRNLAVRKSHENVSIKRLYKDFFDRPCSDLSHSLLHTHYNGER